MLVELLIIVLGLLAAIGLSLSIRRYLILNAFLNSPIKVNTSINEQIKQLLSTDNIVIANLTLFDVLYTSLKVKVNSLDNFGDFDLKNKIENIDDLAVLITESLVSPPLTSFDDLRTFDSNIDMSIYNPLESSAVFNDDPLGTIENLASNVNLDVSSQISNDSLSSQSTVDVSSYGQLFFHIPIIAITVKTVKNWNEYEKNNINAEVAIANTTIDATALTIGSVSGAALGTKFGMILAPFTGGTSIFIGPVIGTAIGLVGGGSIGHWIKMGLYGNKYKKAKKDLENESNRLGNYARIFRQEFLSSFQQLKSSLRNQHDENVSNVRLRWKSSENLLKRIFFPSLKSRVFHKSMGKMKKEYRTQTKPYYDKLYDQIRTMPSYKGGLLLYGQGKGRLLNLKSLVSMHEKISSSIKKVEKKKRHLEYEIEELNKKL